MTRIIVYLLVAGAVGAGVAFWYFRDQSSSTVPPTLQELEATTEADAAKGRFEGVLGDFLVLDPSGPRTEEAAVFRCPDGAKYTYETDQAVLRQHELWSPAFGPHGLGFGCPGEGLRFINNAGRDEGGGRVQLLRVYVKTLPFPIVSMSDAPRDRLELIEVEGHPALIERPLAAVAPFTYLTVIERGPEGGAQGIVVRVGLAPSSEEAIALAEALMP